MNASLSQLTRGVRVGLSQSFVYKKQLSSSLSADDSVAEELLLLSLFEVTSEWSVPVISMSLRKRCSRFAINISLKELLYLANRRKKESKRKYQTELLERIVTKTSFLIHHDSLNVQTFTQ